MIICPSNNFDNFAPYNLLFLFARMTRYINVGHAECSFSLFPPKTMFNFIRKIKLPRVD